MTRIFSVAVLVGLIAGCAAPTPRPLDSNHPANPEAGESPLPSPSQTLAVVPSDPAAPTTETPMPHMQHGGREMGGMRHDAPSSQPSTTPAAVTYTCPMHPEIVPDQPGKCPKCKMKLIPKSKSAAEEGHGGHR